MNNDNKTYLVDFHILDEEEVKNNFYEWIKSRKNTPINFLEELKLTSILPYYMPSYVCDFKIYLDYNVKVQKKHGLNRAVSTLINGKNNFKASDYAMFASKVIPRYDMEQIAPFDFSKLSIDGYEKLKTKKEPFSQSYDDCLNHYRGAILSNLENVVNKSLLKDNSKDMKKKFHNINSHEITKTSLYKVLLPVWVCKYSYNNNTYYCLINGQNGNAYGHTPIKKSILPIILIIIFILIITSVIVFKFIL